MMERVSLLKTYEVECYQICYAFLHQESLAMEAATKTIFALYREDSFYKSDTDQQKSTMRRMALKSSLQIFQKTLKEINKEEAHETSTAYL